MLSCGDARRLGHGRTPSPRMMQANKWEGGTSPEALLAWFPLGSLWKHNLPLLSPLDHSHWAQEHNLVQILLCATTALFGRIRAGAFACGSSLAELELCNSMSR
jgi:hypothetical protein